MGKPMEEVFWLHVDSAWFKIVEQLNVSDLTISQNITDRFNIPWLLTVKFYRLNLKDAMTLYACRQLLKLSMGLKEPQLICF
jgi:hypothetical protein